MIRAFKWLLCEIFGYGGDHDWTATYTENQVALLTGELAAGHLMMRAHKGKIGYRHMNAQEELEAMRSGEIL